MNTYWMVGEHFVYSALYKCFWLYRGPHPLYPFPHLDTFCSDRFKKIVHGYMDEFDARGQSTYLLHRTLNHKNPEMFPSGNLQL